MAVIDRISFVPVAMSFMLYSLPSSALQPVEAFAAAARAHNPDALEAQANVSQQDAHNGPGARPSPCRLWTWRTSAGSQRPG